MSAPVKTFSIGFEGDSAYDETAYARMAATRFKTDHTEFRVSPSAIDLIETLVWHHDGPFGDSSAVPTYLVSKLTREQVTVVLTGDGGDELFAGYNRYVFGTRVLPHVNRVPRSVRTWLAARVGRMSSEPLNRLGPRLGERMHKMSDLLTAESVGEMYRSLLSAWKEPERVLMGPHADRTPAGDNRPMFDESDPASLLDRMMLADQTTYLPDDLLAKIDRASMALSLEVRAPLLDHRVVEFSWRVPHRLKLRGTTGKWILRQVLYRRVPRQIVERPKMGFSVPIDRWLRGPLRTWAASLLAEDEIRRGGLLDPGPIVGAWRDLQEGRRQTGAALWAVIMFQAWRERWQV